MKKEQAEDFVNEVGKQLMRHVDKQDLEKMEELDKALAEFERAVIKIMEFIAE